MSMSAPKKTKSQDSSPVTAQKRSASQKQSADSSCCADSQTTRGQRPSHMADAHATRTKHTKITVKCNCGFPNNLYLRGEGIPGINWKNGVLMKCTKSDEWIWETDVPFDHAQIKVVLNDKQYEVGPNHPLDCGKTITFSPSF